MGLHPVVGLVLVAALFTESGRDILGGCFLITLPIWIIPAFCLFFFLGAIVRLYAQRDL